jgi:hypothetical protein
MPRYRSDGFVVRAGKWEDQSVGCPRGTFAWGGGASNRGPYNTMNLSETYPVRGRRWKSTLTNFGERRFSAVAYAICGRSRPAYARRSYGVPRSGRIRDAACPTQLHHLISGGVNHSAPGRMGIVGAEFQDTDGSIDGAPDDDFQLELANYTRRRQRMVVYAICLR